MTEAKESTKRGLSALLSMTPLPKKKVRKSQRNRGQHKYCLESGVPVLLRRNHKGLMNLLERTQATSNNPELIPW